MSTIRNIASSLIFIALVSTFAFSSLTASAQNQQSGGRRLSKAEMEKLRLKQIDDSIPFFRGIEVKADLVGLIEKAVSDYGQLEAGVKVNIKDHYFPTLELGIGEADHHNDVTAISYSTSAPYFKIGCDVNIMKDRHDIYRVYLGGRLASTDFKFDIAHPDMIDPVWGGTTPFAGKDVKANCRWAELVAGIQAKIWGPINLGWSGRYKRRLSHKDGDFGNVWYVPGYGKTGSSRIDGTFDIIITLNYGKLKN